MRGPFPSKEIRRISERDDPGPPVVPEELLDEKELPDEQQLRKEQKRLNEKEPPDEKGLRNEEP